MSPLLMCWNVLTINSGCSSTQAILPTGIHKVTADSNTFSQACGANYQQNYLFASSFQLIDAIYTVVSCFIDPVYL
jgi:hypothetical protein